MKYLGGSLYKTQRSIPGLCIDAGVPAGPCSGGHGDAADLFPGSGHSVPHQRLADRLSEIRLWLDQKPLHRHQPGLRRSADRHWSFDGNGNPGSLAGLAELRRHLWERK